MPMPPYDMIGSGNYNGTAITANLGVLLTYMDDVTGGLFFPFMLIFFFSVTFISSLIAQQRFTGSMRIETSLVAASFVTTGLSTLLLMAGLGAWWYPALSAMIFLLSLLWTANSSTP